MLLKNKVAFVTGGARGIGAAIVRKMAEQGAAVGFSYRNDTAAAAEQLEWAEKNGLRVAAWQADATQAESAERVLHEVVARWGGLDILVNNAGQTADALLADISLDAWRSVLAVNLEAAFLHTRAVLRLMLPVRNGVILNIGSVVGQHGNTGQAAYAAAKAGLVGLTKSVAKEAGPRNIRCNLISPGLIETA
ncbi:MAG TPA: SDR family NAD(P)-dependent oxidoreductase, partial [Saprospiraceae bacterium]|nr:SDR family NAD(P)-dependent oxidoreductase [Saprospiraceae bacterium]